MTVQLQADYLDIYEGVQSQIHQVKEFDDSCVVSTTYLGRNNRSRKDAREVQVQFSITDQCITVGAK